MIMLKFEHPLNEKVRIYLRIDTLIKQLHSSASFEIPQAYQLFFRSLFDLMDLFEQIQIKSEIGKDLEKQKLACKHWMGVAGVDQAILTTILNEIDTSFKQVMAAERFGVSLKEDRFLSSIRQRFNLPGGTCCFDLPALHYWLHLPLEQRLADAKVWTDTLAPLKQALALMLRLTRETSQLKPQTARNGFFQSEAEDAHVLRLQLPVELGVYPMISGHKNRFAIKFMYFDTGNACSQDIEFDLAIC
ncbi:cell division protein ZapD [Vibrio sp. S11_S32]|uniref:cell division protein ZapD n=2 Tax=Vibrio sp. S11_S32 TaxID=2720225 RepID=UPI00168023DB|nr:cell division protein ZapD [Vibrio sp. S11_S32]